MFNSDELRVSMQTSLGGEKPIEIFLFDLVITSVGTSKDVIQRIQEHLLENLYIHIIQK